MIAPEIRHFHSPDTDDLAAYDPADADRFSLLVQMLIGPADGEGEESFDVQIVTPPWLADRCLAEGPLWGADRLVVSRYDWPSIERSLRARVSECSGSDWTEVAEKIGRFSRWEFEDYEN